MSTIASDALAAALAFDPEAARREYERLCAWRNAWTRLASDTHRMRRLGGLQSTQDRIVARAMRYNRRIGGLLQEFSAYHARIKAETEALHDADNVALIAELAIWRARFPGYRFKQG